MSDKSFVVAAASVAPVFMDREATLDKACSIIAEAAGQGARLIVFPETFVPTYPVWAWRLPASEGELLAELHNELVEQSVSIPSASTDRLCRAARDAGAYVVVGVNEPVIRAGGASLFNTLIYISAAGEIMGRHRKLVPTGPERMVHAQGDGSTLQVFDTSLGRLGGLICWENYMPLARYAMYAQGIQIYAASTWDCGEVWISTMRHIAKEGGVYVIGCGAPSRVGDIPDRYEFKQQYCGADDEWMNPGDSVIVAPDGEILAGPAHKTEKILYAEIEPKPAQGSRWKLDVAGHYARPDVFELIVHTDERAQLWTASSLDTNREGAAGGHEPGDAPAGAELTGAAAEVARGARPDREEIAQVGDGTRDRQG